MDLKRYGGAEDSPRFWQRADLDVFAEQWADRRRRRKPGPPDGTTGWPSERFRFELRFTYGKLLRQFKRRPTATETRAAMDIRDRSFRNYVRRDFGSWEKARERLEAELAAELGQER